jgi:hypothetical protein
VLLQPFDFVTSYEVIEHTENPRQYFSTLCRLISERDGCLVIGTPRADRIDLGDFRRFGVPLHQPHHRHIMSEACLRALGSRHDLRVVRTHDRFHFDTLWPGLNWACLKEYVYQCGGVIDVLFEKPRLQVVCSSPRLLFLALFGYFLFTKENLVIAFARK